MGIAIKQVGFFSPALFAPEDMGEPYKDRILLDGISVGLCRSAGGIVTNALSGHDERRTPRVLPRLLRLAQRQEKTLLHLGVSYPLPLICRYR
jgi:hypothetical protein